MRCFPCRNSRVCLLHSFGFDDLGKQILGFPGLSMRPAASLPSKLDSWMALMAPSRRVFSLSFFCA
jgi:hypothetical protein